MEQPSVTLSATQSVDYLGQTHDWSATDVIYTYKEITRQLAACREKIREENEQKLTAPKAPSSKQQPKNVKEQATRRQLAHQQSSSPQSQQQRTPGNKVIGNISRQLQQQKHESALRAEEKRLIRMQNSLWRRMGPTVGCVGKGNKLVSPRTLKWQKECDILWLFGPLYQPDNDPFMEEDDDVTLVGSPPGTCCPNSPTFGPMPNSLDIPSGSPTPSSSPSSYIKPALKKPVERDPFKDLLEMMLIDANVQKIRRRTTSHPIEPKQKKSLRFSRNLEQVHYTPTHYTIQPAPPHTRRRMSNPFFTKMEEDGVAEGYEQMLARARESKHSGKINIPFAKDGSWIGGNSLDDEDDEFVMPPQLVKSPPRNISRGMPQRRSVAMPAAYTVASARKFVSPPAPVIGAPRNAIEVKHVTNRRVDHETRDSGVVERCVNIASNVKDVVSWCGSMLWNSTVF